jgi:hypothetical protein
MYQLFFHIVPNLKNTLLLYEVYKMMDIKKKNICYIGVVRITRVEDRMGDLTGDIMGVFADDDEALVV